MKNTDKSSYFIIYDFMVTKGLSGVKLLIYALIYSYTIGTYGLYFGSKEHLAETVGSTTRTVYNLLKSLIKEGLLEKYSDGKREGYRCVIGKIHDLELTNEDEVISDDPESLNSEENAFLSELLKMDTEDTAAFSEDEEDGIPVYEKLALLAPKNPKFKLVEFERFEYLTLSEVQYRELLRLVTSDVLWIYFTRFNNMIKNNIKEGKKSPRSHFKVIKQWILEDLSPEKNQVL